MHRQHIEVQLATVQNPDWSPDKDGEKAFPRFEKVPVNVRESAIATLAARGLLDAAQVQAADKFRRLWETMGGKGAGALDYAREYVDGGRIAEPITSGQLDAGRQLKTASQALKAAHGEYAYKLVSYICGQGRSIHEMTETRRQRDTMTDNLKAYLNVLASLWNLAHKRKTVSHAK